MAMPDIPMYVFTGFLESGKTKFIQETLEDERFNTGERTLLLVFEEGEEEYDVSAYPHKEVYEQVLDYEDLSPEMLTDLQKKYRAERVVVELNGMHLAADFYLKTPDHWKIAQEVMFADATTFLSYNANMRQLVVDKLAGAEMLVLNRMAPGTDVMPYHKIARAVNRKIDILYEYTDGSTHYDDIEDRGRDQGRGLCPVLPRYHRGAKEVRGQDREIQGAGRAPAPGKRGDVCSRPVRHDLLRGGYHVHGPAVQIRGGLRPCGQKLGLGNGDGRGQVPHALQGRRTHPDGCECAARRACRAERRNVLIRFIFDPLCTKAAGRDLSAGCFLFWQNGSCRKAGNQV